MDTSTSELHLPSGSAASGDFTLQVTPDSAGWAYSSLRVLALPKGGRIAFSTDHDEVIVLPLSGAAEVGVGGESWPLSGRVDVFAGPSDSLYLPPGTEAVLESAPGGRFALCGARTEQSRPARYLAAADVPVEQRGAGQCARQVRNFGTPDALDAAAIIACEVITPGGNWSSYPAHKHDQQSERESVLEEIYYFEIAAGPAGQPGLGYFRTSSSPGHEIDILAEVRDRDAVLVPYGWHGPAMAAPGYDMYYLNVMAGPGVERVWKITDHPEQAWIRDTWKDR
ncbi:MAG TPA: 5-deoxy-glucuronate isomerase [Microlunatus sp.]